MTLPPLMTAAVTHGHGGPDQLRVHTDWPVAQPGPDEVAVRVTATAINNTDIWSREGAYGAPGDPDAIAGWKGVALDFPRIQGMDVTGTIVAVGHDVDEGWLGRRVIVDPAARYEGSFPADIIGSEVDGGFADYFVCAHARVHDVSGSSLTDAQLACLPTAYGTAMGMIRRADCVPGERILVTGASGGVGTALIDLLASRDCTVIARTSAAASAVVAASGVAEVSIRGRDDLADIAPVDLVLDVVGGDEFGALVERVRDGGRIVTVGAIAGPVVQFDLRRLYLHQRTLIGSTMHTPDDFVELARLAVAGRIGPRVAATFPLAEIARAQEHFVSGDFVGKIVLEPAAT